MAFSDFQEELIALACDATGTQRSGMGLPQTFFTSCEAAGVSIVSYIGDAIAGKGRPMPPYVALQIGDEANLDTLAASVPVRLAPVTFGIVALKGAGATQESCRDAMQAIRTRIESVGALFDTFQFWDRGIIDSSENNAVYRAVAVESKVSIAAATLTYSPGLLLIGDVDA